VHVLMFSGGAGSYFAGTELVRRYCNELDLHILFTDTLIEDQDLYQFLIEGSCRILGYPPKVVSELRWLWEDIPELSSDEQLEDRKIHLEYFRMKANKLMPKFHWVALGETPWETFHRRRFLGNTRQANCSHHLKQDVARKWLEDNCEVDSTTVHLGIHWSEEERFNGSKTGKGAKKLWEPWNVRAPLCEKPLLPHSMAFEQIEKDGIKLPRLYTLGFSHNNCGGFCVKAGQAHFKRLHETMLDRYLYHENKEQEIRQYLDKDVSILRDRVGGTNKRLTLKEFRLRISEKPEQCDLLDVGGCGCFSSDR
jgi:hypothetical protein